MIAVMPAPSWATGIGTWFALAWAGVQASGSALGQLGPSGLESFVQAMIQIFFSDFLDQLFVFFFDPHTILVLSLSFVGHALGMIAAMMPASVGVQVASFGGYLSSGAVGNLIGVGLWVASPIIDPAIAVYCLYTVFAMWVLAAGLRGALWLKELVWPGA